MGRRNENTALVKVSWSNFEVLKDLEGPGVKGGTARLPGLGSAAIHTAA